MDKMSEILVFHMMTIFILFGKILTSNFLNSVLCFAPNPGTHFIDLQDGSAPGQEPRTGFEAPKSWPEERIPRIWFPSMLIFPWPSPGVCT